MDFPLHGGSQDSKSQTNNGNRYGQCNERVCRIDT